MIEIEYSEHVCWAVPQIEIHLPGDRYRIESASHNQVQYCSKNSMMQWLPSEQVTSITPEDSHPIYFHSKIEGLSDQSCMYITFHSAETCRILHSVRPNHRVKIRLYTASWDDNACREELESFQENLQRTFYRIYCTVYLWWRHLFEKVQSAQSVSSSPLMTSPFFTKTTFDDAKKQTPQDTQTWGFFLPWPVRTVVSNSKTTSKATKQTQQENCYRELFTRVNWIRFSTNTLNRRRINRFDCHDDSIPPLGSNGGPSTADLPNSERPFLLKTKPII